MKTNLETDLRTLDTVALDTQGAAVETVRSATKRSAEVEREEVGSKRLGKGIQPETDLEGMRLEGRVVAEFSDRTPSRVGELHLASGRRRQIPLRGSFGDYNVLLGLATGTGVYGPRGMAIRPREGKVLLINVDSPPPGESYITAGSETFILRPRSRGTRPDDFIDRAADRVEGELNGIVDATFRENEV